MENNAKIDLYGKKLIFTYVDKNLNTQGFKIDYLQ